jgi:HupH hydrogenase expression protein, C-terminal conserved region
MGCVSRLDEIGVRVAQQSVAGYARALLNEIAKLLEALVREGKEDAIDLRSLPIGPADYEQLKVLLGQGEAHISLQIMGRTNVVETAYPGVWWVTHFSPEEEVTAERIEVAWIPEIARSHPLDVADGLQRLKETLRKEGACDT